MKSGRKSYLLAGASFLAAAGATARADLTLLNTFADGGSGDPGNVPIPLHVSIGYTGQVVITDFQHLANVYSPQGNFQFGLLPGAPGTGVASPQFAAIGQDGTVYVSDTTRQAIDVFGSNGAGTSNIATSLINPGGLALSPTGILYEGDENNTVELFDTSGNARGSFGSAGTQTGQFSGIGGMTFDSAGTNLYIADINNNRIQVFSSSTDAFESSIGNTSGPGLLFHPNDVAVSGTGLVYVSDQNAGIKVFSTNGTYLTTDIATLGGSSFTLNSIAVAPNGLVYVTGATTVTPLTAYRFFDPAAWASGTNTFTDSTTGPTSVAVGSGQMMGSNLTLDATKGLGVGATTSVNNGGLLTLNGGTLTTSSLAVDGTTGGATFDMTGGTLTANSLTISNGGLADFAQSPLSVTFSGSVSISDAASSLKVDQGATISATGLNNSGQVTIGTAADFIILGSPTNNGTINLAGGELDVRGSFTNSLNATIQGNGTLSTTTGLINNGSIQFTGMTNLDGSILNNATGTIEIPGLVPAVFVNGMTNNGTLTLDAGSIATFAGALTGSGKIVDNGSLVIHANSSVGSISGTGGVTVGNVSTPASLQLTTGGGVTTISSLTIFANSSLDITNNHMIINYAPGTQASVDATIRGYLTNGYNGGTWTGSSGAAAGGGIVSSTAALPGNNAHFGVGYADGADGVVAGLSSGQIEIKYTVYGDANLDGLVNGDDFTILVGNLGKPASKWDKGDFNYDGVVNGDDFTLLVENLGKQANGADIALPASDLAAIDAFAAANGLMADVPEPGCAALFAMTGVGMSLARRRRR
jgi:hypothetical protein